jgi:hypothetical protein
MWLSYDFPGQDLPLPARDVPAIKDGIQQVSRPASGAVSMTPKHCWTASVPQGYQENSATLSLKPFPAVPTLEN